MIKKLILTLMILLEYQNIKDFSAKDYVPNWSEGALVIKKVKNNVPWTYVITDFNGEGVRQNT